MVQCPVGGNSCHILRVGLYRARHIDATTTLYGGESLRHAGGAPAAPTYYEVTLPTPAPATAGDFVALVVEAEHAVGNVAITTTNGSQSYAPNFPTFANLHGSAWATQTKIKRSGVVEGLQATGPIGNISTLAPASVTTLTAAAGVGERRGNPGSHFGCRGRMRNHLPRRPSSQAHPQAHALRHGRSTSACERHPSVAPDGWALGILSLTTSQRPSARGRIDLSRRAPNSPREAHTSSRFLPLSAAAALASGVRVDSVM